VAVYGGAFGRRPPPGLGKLKLGSTSWPEQIAKYVALMIWEEEASGPRANRRRYFSQLYQEIHKSPIAHSEAQLDSLGVGR
jgi:hypothetical protein